MDVEIQRWRDETDTLDRTLLDLPSARAWVALRIAACKRVAGSPILDRVRESEVLSLARRTNPRPLGAQAIERLLTRILRESRRMADQPRSPASGAPAGGSR